MKLFFSNYHMSSGITAIEILIKKENYFIKILTKFEIISMQNFEIILLTKVVNLL